MRSLFQIPPAPPAPAVYATANISGGHLNPAVTLATIISGHMHWKRGVLYIAAQLLGGVFGALFQVSAAGSKN